MTLSITDTQISINARLGNGFLDIDLPNIDDFKKAKEYLKTAGLVFYEDRRNIIHVNIEGNNRLELELCCTLIKAILLAEISGKTIKELHEIKFKLDTSENF